MMRDASSCATPHDYFLKLKNGYERYRSLIHGANESAAGFYRIRKDFDVWERPKVAIVTFFPQALPSPALIFDQPENELLIHGVEDLQEPLSEKTIQGIEWAYQSNRLRLILLLAPYEPPADSWMTHLRRLMGWRTFELKNARQTLVTLHEARMALIQKSSSIRKAVEDGSLALVEAVFDSKTKEVFLDVAEAMKVQAKGVT